MSKINFAPLESSGKQSHPIRTYLRKLGYQFVSVSNAVPATPKIHLQINKKKMVVCCNNDKVSDQEQRNFCEKLIKSLEEDPSKRWTGYFNDRRKGEKNYNIHLTGLE